MKCRAVPPLRHAATGILLPFWDTRVVPRQTLLEYLGADAGKFQSLFAAGLLTPPGGSVQIGTLRSATSYIPAVIWASNRWSPPADVLGVLAGGASDLRTAMQTAERLVASLRGLRVAGLPTTARPITHIQFVPPAAAAEG